jgi:hypothetical protein
MARKITIESIYDDFMEAFNAVKSGKKKAYTLL